MSTKPISQRGGENPSPTGPEGERVGDNDEPRSSDKDNKKLEPIPGPGAPMIPDHSTIDANPIDPRVFYSSSMARRRPRPEIAR